MADVAYVKPLAFLLFPHKASAAHLLVVRDYSIYMVRPSHYLEHTHWNVSVQEAEILRLDTVQRADSAL